MRLFDTISSYPKMHVYAFFIEERKILIKHESRIILTLFSGLNDFESYLPCRLEVCIGSDWVLQSDY